MKEAIETTISFILFAAFITLLILALFFADLDMGITVTKNPCL